MSWRGALRTIGAEIRRQERQARRDAREAERAYQAAVKANAQDRARLEVKAFDRRLDALTTIHREAADQIPWAGFAQQPQPTEPTRPEPVPRFDSQAAAQVLADYKPGFFARLFGLTGERKRLEAALADATALEDSQDAAALRAHADALREWEDATTRWRDRRELAEQILARDAEAYREVISSLDALEEIGSLIGTQTIQIGGSPTRITVSLSVREDAVVPAEVKTLTARGAVSAKKMAAARRLEIYEDYVCGTALRIAREMLAALPIDDVLVHIDTNLLNGATGHLEKKTILSVLCPREAMDAVKWANADASDVVEKLLHNMKRLGRGKGFAAVERLQPPTMVPPTYRTP
jgi:hypothetical protein